MSRIFSEQIGQPPARQNQQGQGDEAVRIAAQELLADNVYGRQLQSKVEAMLKAGKTDADVARFVAEKSQECDFVTGQNHVNFWGEHELSVDLTAEDGGESQIADQLHAIEDYAKDEAAPEGSEAAIATIEAYGAPEK